MKIAFVGKGGSGKTTLTSLLCKYIASIGLPVLVVDADINQHLAAALDLDEQLPSMGLEINKIKKYLRGNNPLIPFDETMVKTTPPGRGSNLLALEKPNPIFEYFQKQTGGIKAMAVGTFDQSDLGVKCYHSKTGAVELLLNHLVDNQKEYIIVDMTAGADSFASGMFTRFDLTFVIVEPTLKSLAVYEQYKHYAKDYEVALKVVGNKIEAPEDLEFIKQKTGNDFLAGFVKSAFVKRAEKGRAEDFSQLEPQNLKILQTMLAAVDARKKDWPKFYKQMVEFHIKNGESWANQQLGIDAKTQIDPEFSFKL